MRKHSMHLPGLRMLTSQHILHHIPGLANLLSSLLLSTNVAIDLPKQCLGDQRTLVSSAVDRGKSVDGILKILNNFCSPALQASKIRPTSHSVQKSRMSLPKGLLHNRNDHCEQ